MLINGVNYHVRVAGQGEPILLLHGFTGSGDSWTPLMDALHSEFEVIAVDLLGHGLTDSPADYRRYRIDEAARDLRALCDQLQIQQIHVVGYSMGGRLALYFALEHASRVKSLVLESASPGLADAHDREVRRQSDDALADQIERDGIEAFVDYWESIPLFASQRSLSSEMKASLRQQRLRSNPSGVANSLRGMGTGQQPSLWDRLHEVMVPVQLVAGEMDVKYVAIATKMNEKITTSHLAIVKDAGHTVHLEQPGIFRRMLHDHLLRFSR